MPNTFFIAKMIVVLLIGMWIFCKFTQISGFFGIFVENMFYHGLIKGLLFKSNYHYEHSIPSGVSLFVFGVFHFIVGRAASWGGSPQRASRFDNPQ